MPDELTSLMQLCNADCVILSKNNRQLTDNARLSTSFNLIDVGHAIENATANFQTSFPQGSDATVACRKAGLLLFTSGTTGPPKGALHSMADFHAECVQVQKSYDLSAGDLMLDCSGFVNWRVTLTFMLSQLIAGGCVELCNKLFSPDWFWQRVKHGSIDIVTLTPRTLDLLAKHFLVI